MAYPNAVTAFSRGTVATVLPFSVTKCSAHRFDRRQRHSKRHSVVSYFVVHCAWDYRHQWHRHRSPLDICHSIRNCCNAIRENTCEPRYPYVHRTSTAAQRTPHTLSNRQYAMATSKGYDSHPGDAVAIAIVPIRYDWFQHSFAANCSHTHRGWPVCFRTKTECEWAQLW